MQKRFLFLLFTIFFLCFTSISVLAQPTPGHDADVIHSEATVVDGHIDTLMHIVDEDTWLPALDIGEETDRKSTRLNSSHVAISYAVFCLKKKKKKTNNVRGQIPARLTAT